MEFLFVIKMFKLEYLFSTITLIKNFSKDADDNLVDLKNQKQILFFCHR
jgi:hypothetical protein